MTYHVHVEGRDKIAQRHMSGYRVSFSFEGICGADIIITPLGDIISQSTIQPHLTAGAVMIQLKNSRDLDASVIDQRLFESLLRMNTWDASPYQRGLLLTGKFENRKGHLYIDGQRSMISWSSFRGAWDAWVIRGGVVYPIIERDELQDFVDSLGSKLFVSDPFLQANQAKKRRMFKAQKKFTQNMTLSQRARMASQGIDQHDLRHLLVNMEGLSDKTVQGMWELMKESVVSMDMKGLLSLLHADRFLEVKGIGKVINEKIKKQLGFGNE